MPLLRFLAVGIANTAVGVGVIIAAQAWLGLSPLPANALGYGVAIPLSFALNRRWTFSHDGPTRPAMLKYAVVLALAYVANVAVLTLAITALNRPDEIAQVSGMLAYTLTSYFGMRFLAFGQARQL